MINKLINLLINNEEKIVLFSPLHMPLILIFGQSIIKSNLV